MSCASFIAESFAVRTAAHFLHLQSRSYAQHMALGSFYEALPGFIDRYAEVYQGLEGLITKYPGVSSPSTPPDAITLLTDYLELVKEELAEDVEYESLKNILAEIEELTASTLYKLRFLK